MTLKDEYLHVRWRELRRNGRADFIWRRRVAGRYLPVAAAVCAVVYLRADGWKPSSAAFFWLVAGVIAFVVSLLFARGEWAHREEEFRRFCEARNESVVSSD